MSKITVPRVFKDDHFNEYSESGAKRKEQLHSKGRAFLRSVAKYIGLQPEQYDLRSNKGGVAVSGEVTLHTDHLYVQLLESCIGSGGVSIMYRSCKGRKDYCGGRNRFLHASRLADHPAQFGQWLAEIKAIQAGADSR